MQAVKKSLLLFIKRFLVVVFIYQLSRLFFYCFNKKFFTEITPDVVIGGLRFDLSSLGYINLLFGLLHTFPGTLQNNTTYQKGLKFGFYTANLLFIATNFIDLEYFKFTGKRSTFSMITAGGMGQEIGGLLVSYSVDFWYIPFIFMLTAFLFWKLLPTDKNKEKNSFSWKALGVCFLTISALFIMGRGGFQKKPLRIVDASAYGKLGQSALVLNTPFTILKTLSNKEKLDVISYYKPEELNAIFNPIRQFKTDSVAVKKNVVVLILESFGRENIQRGYTPFLDSLIQKSYFFENAFANGKLSIDAVPSTISSIPSLMNNSLIASSYALNDVKAFPKVMKENGYVHTSFFHGAFNGSQNFDQYSNVAGYDTYFGKDQYEGPEAFDGKWGIFDEEFLQFFAYKITSFKQPFFTTLFTISSHAPFIIPQKYKGKFPKGTTEIHETIAYADFALRKFFETAQKKPWYSNTLFIITADHTSSSGEEVYYKNNIGKFKIPILFFEPGNPEFVGKNTDCFQQIDILPSVLDYLDLKSDVITYGQSFRDKDQFVVTYLDNVYNYITGDYYLAFDGKKSIGLYNWKKDPLLKHNLLTHQLKRVVAMEQFIKAYIQSFNTRVSKNQLIIR